MKHRCIQLYKRIDQKSIISFWCFRRFRGIYAFKILDAFTTANMDSRLDAVTKAGNGAAMRKASGQRAHKKRADRTDSPYHVFVIGADYAFFDIFRQKIGINSLFFQKISCVLAVFCKNGHFARQSRFSWIIAVFEKKPCRKTKGREVLFDKIRQKIDRNRSNTQKTHQNQNIIARSTCFVRKRHVLRENRFEMP